jgi:hypothetical protein
MLEAANELSPKLCPRCGQTSDVSVFLIKQTDIRPGQFVRVAPFIEGDMKAHTRVPESERIRVSNGAPEAIERAGQEPKLHEGSRAERAESHRSRSLVSQRGKRIDGRDTECRQHTGSRGNDYDKQDDNKKNRRIMPT